MLRSVAFKLMVVLTAGVALLAWRGVYSADVVSGPAEIIDGDFLRILGRELRLKGIDAPELRQTCTSDGKPLPCGQDAKQALVRATRGALLTCDVRGTDRYRRGLAICSIGGEVINARLVREGHAIAFGDYEREESTARRDKRGIWATTFDTPRAWRDSHGRGAR